MLVLGQGQAESLTTVADLRDFIVSSRLLRKERLLVNHYRNTCYHKMECEM
jgi:hypothetical protein